MDKVDDIYKVQRVKIEDILLSVQDDGDSGSDLVTFLSIFREKENVQIRVLHFRNLLTVGKKSTSMS